MENRFLGFGIILNLILMYSNGSLINYEDSLPQFKIAEPTIDLKEDVSVESSNLDTSIERLLKEQSVILDRLINMTIAHEETFRRLLKDTNKDEFTLTIPENTRRSVPKPQFSPQRVAMRMEKILPSYANLVKDIFMNNVGDIAEPHSSEYEELDRTGDSDDSENEESILPNSRRSGSNIKENTNTNWCVNAFRCTRTYIPICGHDNAFGFAKFDDICHMLNSNCYWKFNFVLVPACKP